MDDLRVKRIQKKLKDLYDGKIDLSDVPEQIDIEKCFLSRALAAYALVMKTGISIKESCEAVTDGGQDLGIDCIYRDEFSKKMYIIQSKMINDGKSSINLGDMNIFCSGIESILNLDLDSANLKLQKMKDMIESVLNDISYKMVAITIYTSDTKISSPAIKELNKLKNRVNNDAPDELMIFEPIYLSNIYKKMSDNSTYDVINLENIQLENWGTIEYDNCEVKAFYGIISAYLIGEWWSKYKMALFSKNIRGFKGDTEVNNGIKEVLTNEPENFCFYNNGIKILASKISRAGINSSERKFGTFTAENASIVNGAQTVGSIGEFFENNPLGLEKAKVFIQLLEVKNIESKMGLEITRLSNTQNRIENKDFISVYDNYHERIRIDFALDNIDYNYKAGVTTNRFDKVCSIDEAIIAHGCFLENVDVSTQIKRGIGRIYEDLTKAPYKLIFNDSITTHLLWNCITISKLFEKNIFSLKSSLSSEEKPISIHGNRFILHMLYQYIKKTSFSKNIGKEYLELEINQDFISYITENTLSLVKQTAIAKKELFPESYPANIFKNSRKCTVLEEKVFEIFS